MRVNFRLLVVALAAGQALTCTAAAAAAFSTSAPSGGAVPAVRHPVASVSALTVSIPARRVVSPHPKVPARRRVALHTVRRHHHAPTLRLRSVAVPAAHTSGNVPAVAVTVPESKLTTQQQLDLAVARIPGHADPKTRWVLTSAYGSWGTADWYHNIVYVSPTVPSNRMYDVVIHEYSHLQSVAAYSGNVDLAMSAMNGYFGGSGLTGAERAADCMALLQGATWTHYTPCTDAHWRDGARRLIQGERLS